MAKRHAGALLFSICLAASGFAGCSCSSDESDSGGGGNSTASNSTGSNVGGSTGTGFTEGQVIAIEIDPPSASILVDNGVIPAAVDFKVFAVKDDNSKTEVTGSWTFNRPDIAQTDGAGDVTATGLLGGDGTLQVSYGTFTANATVTVKLKIDSDPEMVPQNIKDLFGSANTADPTLALLYPYNNTVFPRGLVGPVVQWNGGGAADIYRVHMESTHFEFTGWGTVPAPSRYSLPTLPDDVWRKLTDSSAGDLAVEVQRYDGTTAYLPTQQGWKIAPGNLAGTIYYWEVNNGNVVRLQPGATAPEAFLQKPPGVTCVACHSVSADGSTLVASFNGGASPWGTFNSADGSSVYSSGQPSGFQAIAPDGSHVVWGSWVGGGFNSDGTLHLSTKDNTATLAQIAPGIGAPAHPAWSKDGSQIAFSVRTDGNGLDFTQSTLWIADVALSPPAFTNIGQIVANDVMRPTVTFPTFSPDSQWIAFERATQARTRGAASEIWLTTPDGLVQIPLDKANGKGIIADAQASLNYEPTFNPVAAGGYIWLVTVSERQYGNTLTDTNTNTRRKQLWVTAIDPNPQPGVDPSHPSFWLPGQELTNQNMRGEWALSPCKQMGEECSAGYECCDGYCIQDPQDAVFKCSDTPGGCSQVGDACLTAADCCDPLASCTNGFCSSSVPN